MADIKVSELNDGVVDSSSYLLESNTNVSYKVKASDIGTFVNASQADYSLNTTANTIVGAINEVATASGTTYDNTSSGLSATEVQSAVDEVNDKFDNLSEKKSNKVTSISSSSTDDQYPSAKSVYGMLNGLLGVMRAIGKTRQTIEQCGIFTRVQIHQHMTYQRHIASFSYLRSR